MLRTMVVGVRIGRIVMPWILGISGAIVFLMFIVVASTWVGIPTATDRLATKLTQAAISIGFDLRYSDYLDKASWVVAFLLIVVGWIGYAYLTVFVVNRLAFHR